MSINGCSRFSRIGRMAAGDPGRAGTSRRLKWVLGGCPTWLMRAIIAEEKLNCSPYLICTVASRKGKVRRILDTYLHIYERYMLEAREVLRDA